MKVFDCIIVGGGPAGLSAAIYLGRYKRSHMLIDMGWGRSTSHELNENYLGFPEGIRIQELRHLGKIQAEKFGTIHCQDKITSIEKKKNLFELCGGDSKYHCRSLILATGVTDLWPDFENVHDYIGKTLFWCITCDGIKTVSKKLLIVGDTDDASCTAAQLQSFTKDITFVTNRKKGKHRISPKWLKRLKKAGIKVVEGIINEAHGKDGRFHFIKLESGERINLEIMFSELGATPNSELAKEIGVHVDEHGYIKANYEMKTNVPMVFAIGDVTRRHSHQVVIAAAEGAQAGESANYELYGPEQRFE